MQLIRTLLLLAFTVALVAFIAINWQTVPLNLWPLDDGNYVHLEWPVYRDRFDGAGVPADVADP